MKNQKPFSSLTNMKTLNKFFLLALILLTAFSIYYFLNKSLYLFSIDKTKTKKNIEITIPQSAYSSKKSLLITPLSKDSQEYIELKSYRNFYGEIYRIEFSDDSKESSLLPVTVRYKIPSEMYYGDNFVHYSLVYATNEESFIISDFTGARIVETANQYFIEADTFQLSKIKYVGLVLDSPVEASYGLRIMKESSPTIEPDIILVPGSDLNFLGKLVNVSDKIYDYSIWSSLFPTRTIWRYDYPLTSTRSKNYVDSFDSFVDRTGINSYIEYESKKFAQELKRFPNRKFDIIAHGIGGLIVRYALESDPNIKNVKNLVLISTPNKGTNLANPLFFNLIWGKDLNLLSKLLGVEKATISIIMAENAFYLDLINSYYYDITPSSSFLNTANSFERRSDIRYLVIGGTNSNIEEDITNKVISQIYPEFIDGSADGVVSLESAYLKGADEFFTVDKNFYDIYLDKDVLNKVKDFLNESLTTLTVKPFEDDDFIEYQYELEQTKTPAQEIKNEIKNVTKFKLPSSYRETQILKSPVKIGTLKEERIKIVSIEDNILFESSTGVYNNKLKKILNDRVLGGLLYDNVYYLTTSNGVYTIDKDYKISKLLDEIPAVGDEIYYIPEYGFLNIEYTIDSSKIYLNGKEVLSNVNFIKLKSKGKDVYAVFEDKIYKINDNKLTEFFSLTEIQKSINVSLGKIVDFDKNNSTLFVLTSDYKLLFVDSLTNEVQVIGKEDIGRLGVQIYQDNLYVYGNNHITYFNLKDNIFPGFYQRLSLNIKDFVIKNDLEVWVVFENDNLGYDIYKYTL